ncbi:MAG: 2-amino-4-hydroxy-6-hydroxymethyldihydropteridine diphosphokinase [Caldivirga sp.]|uniref:2-amino-4-hydroxy-6- hydroxymethyldihydropteridine diphosphokinase n=1 Tax=Caldivirga sp. TaxID=2080243 RepID=UPI003D13D451
MNEGLFKISIRGLRVETIIGVKPSERAKPQQVVIDVDAWADLSEGAAKDSIECTVDYKVLKDELISYVSNVDFKLIETLADKVAKVCLQDHRIRMVRVKVEKPGALTGAEAASVEVVKERRSKLVDVYIAVGSNINPSGNVKEAIVKLRNEFGPLKVSTVYLTKPIPDNQPPYYNCVVWVKTALSPIIIKETLRSIEDELGRTRVGDKYAPRTIDLDLILYGNLIINGGGLRIPDPEISSRPFLTIPLFELNPDLVIPGLNKSIREIIKGVNGKDMKPLLEFTEELRKLAEG